MRAFLDDYVRGRTQGRYLAASLPDLPFGGGQFDLALCSHFLFLYTDQLSCAFHRQAVRELCRVAREVRIFPLLDLGRNEAAGEAFAQARSLRPESPFAVFGLARVCLRTGRAQEAVRLLEDVAAERGQRDPFKLEVTGTIGHGRGTRE